MSRSIFVCVLVLILAGLAAPSAFSAAAQQVDPELLAGLKARSIGPASMSGRIAHIEAVEADPNIIYVGAATGGLWKSVNAGLTWKPIFDDQPVAAIGAVSVFQPNPDVVWVGTGEGNTRNSVSVGNGIYKSIDAGENWTHLGLDQTERIHRILLDPANPDIAYVCALGKLWGENAERGVFKTADGGATWGHVLKVDEKTGCADLEMDPSNPQKLIAAMWQHRRWPWFFKSGGPGSGLFVTVDGGKTWTKKAVEDGLPKGDLGRIGLGFSPSNPEIVYALVEAKKSAFLRSENGGKTWKAVNTTTNIASRPFYYADIRIDPEFPNRIYSLQGQITLSEDGGKNFRNYVGFRGLHSDHHAMWINPRDGRHIIAGNDGGVGISHDRGLTWRFVRNLPLAQFYHIRVDNDRPYNIYGGLQDNGSWRGPSEIWEGFIASGIRNSYWRMISFGDGFDTLPDPEDSERGYSMSQGGNLYRWNLHNGEARSIRPAGPDGVKLRFNWNAGIAQDPFDTATIYYGSQFVHKSTDRGLTWEIISDDLTSNNPEWQKQDESGGLTLDVTNAENFTTIITIEPSPVQQGVLWVGTDDGRIHVSRDGGQKWQSVEKNVKGVPANTWVPHITPSKFDAATAFAVFDNHRRSDWTPYVYQTTNYGRSWSSLATDDISGYTLKVEQDPVNKNLLFLGTEFGLYASLNGGQDWFKWTHGVPTASAMDMVIQPQENDLVVGTHGRAVFILDDISALRTVSPELLKKPIHLFEIPEAQQYRANASPGELVPSQGEFFGTNEPYGALLTFSLNAPDLPHPNEKIERKRQEAKRQKGEAPKEEKKEEKKPGPRAPKGPQVEIKIRNSDGKLLRTFKQKAYLGINRVAWNLRADSFKRPGQDPFAAFFGSGGPEVVPGDYEVTVKYKEAEAKGTVHVLADPRAEISPADRQAHWDTLQRAGRLQETVTEAVKRITDTRSDIDIITKKLNDTGKNDNADGEKKENPHKDLLKLAGEVKKALTEMEKRLWNPPDTKGIVAGNSALSKIGNVMFRVGSSWEAPAPPQLTYLRQAEDHLNKVLADYNELFATKVADFRTKVRETDVELLPEGEPLAVKNE